jgi:hypothetical protein
MRRLLPLVLMLAVAGCSDPTPSAPAGNASIAKADHTEVIKLRQKLKAANQQIVEITKRAGGYLAANKNLENVLAREERGEPEYEPAAALCWQDYCPCDESRDMDRLLCRNLRGGVAVSRDQMAAGAAMRDGNNLLDKWKAENDY